MTYSQIFAGRFLQCGSRWLLWLSSFFEKISEQLPVVILGAEGDCVRKFLAVWVLVKHLSSLSEG